MSAKYHIRLDGTPGLCRATKGNCPFGDDSEHFSSYESAQRASLEQMEREFGVGFSDEPYSSSPIIKGDFTDFDVSILKQINTDGLTFEKINKPGTDPKYKIEGLEDVENGIIAFDNSRMSGDYQYKFSTDGGQSYSINNVEQLNKTLGELKEKGRLEEVTRRALKQWNSMPYNDPKAATLQRIIHENELVLGKTINTKLEDKAWSDDSNDRVMAAESGYEHEFLIDDENEFVRAAVASNGYGLDKLSKDPHPIVRATVADQGSHLEELSKDENDIVRSAVARKGYGYDFLVNDDSAKVRASVAESGKKLEVLIEDKDPIVRAAVLRNLGSPNDIGRFFTEDENPVIRKMVAERGIALDKLIHDEDPSVRTAAERKLNEK